MALRYHLEPGKWETLQGKWPYRKRNVELLFIMFPDGVHRKVHITIATAHLVNLLNVVVVPDDIEMVITPPDVTQPVEIARVRFAFPIGLRRTWWPLKATADTPIAIQLVLR